ncbi:replication factor C subunit 4-like [Corticium candelabrum]|uniref:replication factor C subunit 4-like n=1 Tax=Corticium candelabrum TaxID=121492 RepID=UPI002E2607F0|nr:replication factor C subunit 4-like [Corticium candelabrum]
MDAFLHRSSSTKESSKPQPVDKRRDVTPWVEKYRPQKVEDVACQEEVVAVMKKVIQGADLPNLLLYGPPGTGKTSTILAAARQLFGIEMYKRRVLELNASDERGIQVIRDKVKQFSQWTASATRPDGCPCPPFKIVILDEADSMTSSAQAALRRTMEKETKTTRFCLICNYVSRIIEPLTSRCTKFRFKPLAGEAVQTRLTEICEKENVRCDETALSTLMDVSEGDLRKAITLLQSAHRLKGGEIVMEGDIIEIAAVIPSERLDLLIDTCHSDSYDKLDVVVKDIIADGFPASQLVSQIHDKIMLMDLTDQQLAVIAERLAVVDFRLLDRADEYLQIMDLCTVIMNQVCHPATDE